VTLELEVESDERSFRGRAASTDIIEASAVAYVNAVTEIPPRGLLGPAHARGLAFLYAESDIAALIGAARSLAPSGGLRPHTYATLIGLLACTGLRITEALTLRADDVDLSAGVLTIRQTKFRKSRLVPLHASAVAPLRDYTADRDRRCDRKPDMTFFVSDTGHRLPYTTVRHAFHALLRQAMPGVVPVNRVRPRLHDFRKNWTFLGSDRGGRMAAVLYSHTGTCKHHDIDPFAYLQDILRRLPSDPARELDEYLPDVWFQSHPSARRKRAA
jgi:integrase